MMTGAAFVALAPAGGPQFARLLPLNGWLAYVVA